MTAKISASADGLYGSLAVGATEVVKFGLKGLFECIPATSYANDVAAQAAGVPIGGLYHTTGTVKVRLA